MGEQRTSGAHVGAKNNGNVGSHAAEIAQVAEKQLEEIRERFGEVSERVVGFIRERPGTSILMALGAGYLIGRVLRS